MITANGKIALRRFVAGYEFTIADTIAVGVGNTAGEAMQFEWARFPIASVGTNTDNSLVIFKVDSRINLVGKVYEVGLIQNGGGLMKDIILSHFAVEEEWPGTFTATNSRLNQGLKINANQTASTLINPTGLQSTAEKDALVIAGFSAAAGNVRVTLEFDNGSTALATFAMPNGYGFGSVLRSDMTKSAGVNWESLVKITVNPSVDFTADLLKFKIVNPLNEILVARSVLTTPFTTDVTLPLEIEYPIGVNFAA